MPAWLRSGSYCVGTLKFRPEGGFGTFLSSIDGKVTVVVLSLVFVFIVGALLEKLGYPIAKKEER
jgi:hypothetical protein